MVFCKKGVLRNFSKFTGKHLCQSLFLIKLPKACIFIKKETLAQVFSCEFCEISKNIFYYRTPLVAASVYFITENGICNPETNFVLRILLNKSMIKIKTVVLLLKTAYLIVHPKLVI